MHIVDMYFLKFLCFALLCNVVFTQEIYVTDMNFRIEAGSRTCFFEMGKAGQIMELYYQVIDGQHGDLDISVDVIDPEGVKLLADYKKSQNSIIMDLVKDGEYVFCMDNTYSLMNSKLVFMNVVIEDTVKEKDEKVSVVDGDGAEHEEVEIVEWVGTTEDGEEYKIDVTLIIDSLIKTLNHVMKARHMLELYSASKSRDSYMALEDTFIVDAWSAFQILFMMIVGLIQVYMIKKLFTKQIYTAKA
ncbi:transmembrane emp24 domain-containing protein 5-like [Epargyreus clarus]|uniref:transmembrane emp24 domain-containing protein 5-like n=1 Tax=Epargyreus clarus TaxID=520877 RepID=UPI003C2D0DFD